MFELGKSREEMENRYGAQLDTCQKKVGSSWVLAARISGVVQKYSFIKFTVT